MSNNFFEQQNSVSRPIQGAPPLTVAQLTSQMQSLLEGSFGSVAVVGEISNLSLPKSGHCYFTLKDSSAQLSSVIWRSSMTRLRFNLENGLKVICRGKIEIYPPQGKYQLIVSKIEPQGIGALELAYRQLLERLSAEGLFSAQRKKPIPRSFKTVGVITSGTGAAIRDFLNIMYRHSRRYRVFLVPVQVQGSGASIEIARALALLNGLDRADRPDVIALIRGGGSLEDLWAFNEEPAVRAVAASEIPVVTGIGHEIDTSLCDLAADIHALTPSDAAARLIPDDREFLANLNALRSRLDRIARLRMDHLQDSLDRVKNSKLFTNPDEVLIGSRAVAVQNEEQQLNKVMKHYLEKRKEKIASLAARLDALSPLAVLGRGYSLTRTPEGIVVRAASEVAPGQTVITKLGQGAIECRVDKVLPD